MTKHEYQTLKTISVIDRNHPLLSIQHLTDTSNRTLLFGRMKDRSQYHIYIKNQKIHCVQYDVTWLHNTPSPEGLCTLKPHTNQEYIPPNIAKIYPERSDYEFCKLLLQTGVTIPFAPYIDSVEWTACSKKNQFDDSPYFGYSETH